MINCEYFLTNMQQHFAKHPTKMQLEAYKICITFYKTFFFFFAKLN
jgi:hypothetical protein